MRVLIDTNVFIRLTFEPETLSASIRQTVDDAQERFFSSASAWEMAIKAALGKLRLGSPVADYVATRLPRMRTLLLPVSLGHIGAVETLPIVHRDPFDRMLVAQALVESLTVVTTDRRLEAYGVNIVS